MRPASRGTPGPPTLTITAPSDNEQPIDPAMLRVQARLRRLILISGLTLGLGIVAVFGAVLYRTFAAASAVSSTGAAAVSGRLTPGDLGLPADARLVATSADGSRLVLTYVEAGGNTLIFLDERTLRLIGRLDLPARP